MKNIFEDDTVARTPRNASQLTMKVLYVAFAVVSAVSALQNTYAPNYNELTSGQYVPDDSGRYVPDGSGQYIPDHSGDYIPDGLGGYLGDGSGTYKGDGSGGYKGDGGAYKGDGGAYKGGRFGGGGGGSGSGGFGQGGGNRGTGGLSLVKPSFNGIGSTNLLGSGSNENRQTVKPANPFVSGQGSGAFGNAASATSQVTSKGPKYGSGSDFSGSRYADGRWKIIRQSGDVDTDGYHWEYETENGITAEESGKLANKGTDNEAMKAKGFFQYTGPDNAVYHVSYTSDENGFLPDGQHLPTPPPIPGEIVRSLEFLKSIGKL